MTAVARGSLKTLKAQETTPPTCILTMQTINGLLTTMLFSKKNASTTLRQTVIPASLLLTERLERVKEGAESDHRCV